MTRTRIIIVLSAIAGALTGDIVSGQSASRPVQPQVDKLFARWSTRTPGCAVGADVNGAPVVRAAYGMADLEHDVPIALDTIFEVGSVSKQFTAAAVLLVERDGRLSLDDPARRYIPELPEFGTPITIRQMLNHTAGLRDWGSLAAIAGWPRSTRVHTHAHVLDIVSRQRMLNFPPGTRWSYSNTGYNLAAILVERVSGMSFADFTRTRIFEPLGMKDTSWRDDHTRVVKRRAIAYDEREGVFSTLMPFENVHGNGGLLTTVADLLAWNQNFSEPIVGDAAFAVDMQRRTRFNDGRDHEYAMGLYVDTYRGRREVDHSGGTAGYVAHLARYPDHGVSVAVMCNVRTAGPTASAKAIADLLLPPTGGIAGSSISGLLDPDEGPRFAGLYRSLIPVGTLTISAQKGSLAATNAGPLTRRSALRFEGGADLVYDFDDRGGLRVIDEFGTSDAYERVEPWQPGADELKALAGRYTSDEIETTMSVVFTEGRLVLRRRTGPEMPLNPVFTDGFLSPPLGWILVRRDGTGRAIGLSVNQGRVWDLRFDRQPD